MTHLPRHLTFTGIDARTDFDRVEDLSSRYPIEWGILFSPKRQGLEPRYPDTETVSRFVWMAQISGSRVNMAAHLCGDAAKEVLDKVATRFLRGVPKGWIERYQINTSVRDPSVAKVEAFARARGARGILQCRGDTFPSSFDVDWLYDRSGGRGQLPESWPRPQYVNQFVGFAGGIGPDTIDQVLSDLQEIVTEKNPYWLDMESAIRTDDWLDLDKCEAVCRTVYGEK